ncbi:GTP-binding protein [Actinoplanes sp. NPDC051494]|uniref:GTP-binding protein n=1 Tax=Actinoplanes sp. NPDC051494 TaxID=3363907 RepID=UPI0037AB1283
MPPLVVMLSGFWAHATGDAAQELLAGEPRARLLHYELPRPGCLVRDGHTTGTGDDPVTALVRDVLAIARGSRVPGLIVMVPESCEPDQVRAAWAAHVPPGGPLLGALITVVAADLLLDGLTDESSLRSVALQQDRADARTVGDVVARQVEQADTVLVSGRPDGDDEWEAERLRTLLRRLAPWAAHPDLDDPALPAVARRPARQHTPVAPATRGLRGLLVGAHEPVPHDGVLSCVFRARRPFHPGRLHDALPTVTDQVLRSRGHLWLATRPDLVLTWESAGTLTVRPAGHWLADQPDERWSAEDDLRRAAAALAWDPYFGDRHQHLAFIGFDIDPVRIDRILSGCLLTDEELSRGTDYWTGVSAAYADLFPLEPAMPAR